MTSSGGYTIEFSPLAEIDLETIGDFIAIDHPARAATFVTELRAACRNITKLPLAYRRRPEFGPTIRSRAHRHYVIFFAVSENKVTIARILHSARELPGAFGEV